MRSNVGKYSYCASLVAAELQDLAHMHMVPALVEAILASSSSSRL